MASPEGQFDLAEYMLHHVANSHEWHPLPKIHIPLPAPLSLHLFMILLAAGLLIYLFRIHFNFSQSYPKGRWTNVLEAFVLFIRNDIAIACLGEEDGRKFTPLLCTFFFMILTLNLLGLIPLFSTATANFNVTGGLMLAIFSYQTVGAVRQNGIKQFCGAFVPPGVPLPILFVLVPVEIIGFFIKNIVLMVRLFANLLAGHFVILACFGLTAILGFVVLPAVLPVVVFVYFLEIFVAFLQTYIFTMLATVFLSVVYHPEH